MTLSEFKAWFEGFTEGIEGAPSEKQFERIKAKVAKIDGTPITQTVYVRDYWHQYWDNYHRTTMPWPYSSGGYVAGVSTTNASVMQLQAQRQGPEFDSHRAMFALGKEEYAA